MVKLWARRVWTLELSLVSGRRRLCMKGSLTIRNIIGMKGSRPWIPPQFMLLKAHTHAQIPQLISSGTWPDAIISHSRHIHDRTHHSTVHPSSRLSTQPFTWTVLIPFWLWPQARWCNLMRNIWFYRSLVSMLLQYYFCDDWHLLLLSFQLTGKAFGLREYARIRPINNLLLDKQILIC